MGFVRADVYLVDDFAGTRTHVGRPWGTYVHKERILEACKIVAENHRGPEIVRLDLDS